MTEKRDKTAERKAEKEKKSELEQLQTDYAGLNDKYLRLMAEYDNFRKRSVRERENIYPDAIAKAAECFLPVIDNFERALAADCIDPEYKKGTELTCKSLLEAFGTLHVEAFGEPGEGFDPQRHNAVMHVEDEAQQSSVVVEVFQKGYRIGDRILRYAMVKVAN
ncbi:MAG: nucleotide exchange factor GrpE, partial [Oscillospiraceae bacterium]